MQVRVSIQFELPTEHDREAMRCLADSLTDNRDGVRVFANPKQPDWRVTEFTMPTEAQYIALPKIEGPIRIHAWNRCDSTIAFPYTEAERARADGRAARRRARRRKT